MSDVEKLVKLFRDELNKQTNILKGDLAKIEERIGEEGKITRKEISSLRDRVSGLEEQFVLLERRLRRNSIIVSGLNVDSGNVVSSTISEINSLLGLNLTVKDISNIYKLGKTNSSPIKVEFLSFLTKSVVVSNKKKT